MESFDGWIFTLEDVRPDMIDDYYFSPLPHFYVPRLQHYRLFVEFVVVCSLLERNTHVQLTKLSSTDTRK